MRFMLISNMDLAEQSLRHAPGMSLPRSNISAKRIWSRKPNNQYSANPRCYQPKPNAGHRKKAGQGVIAQGIGETISDKVQSDHTCDNQSDGNEDPAVSPHGKPPAREFQVQRPNLSNLHAISHYRTLNYSPKGTRKPSSDGWS
jgi:hypothetical protein